MRVCRYFWIAILVACALFRGEVMAATAPVYNGKMNVAVGSVINQKVSKWGFAANDPRVAATMNGVGAGVATVAVAVVGGTVATVGWPAVLVAAGVTALVTGAVALAQDSIYKWLFNSDGTVTTQGSGVDSLTGGMVAHSSNCGGDGQVWASSVSAVGAGCAAVSQASWGNSPNAPNYSVISCDASSCRMHRSACVGGGCPAYDYTVFVGAGTAPSNATCPSGVYGSSGCLSPIGLGTPSVTAAPVSDAIANVPNAELAKPVSDEMLAAAANAAWKSMPSAAQNGLPWSALDPVTPADIVEWKAANSEAVPSIGDMLAPVAASTAQTVSIGQSGAMPIPGPVPTPGTGTQVDLGPNPNIGAPTLEATPTAQSILDPIFNLMPDLKSFTVPTHSSACPKPSFTAFSKTYVIESQCALLEANRSIIEAVMMLVWSIAAVFIVLRA